MWQPCHWELADVQVLTAKFLNSAFSRGVESYILNSTVSGAAPIPQKRELLQKALKVGSEIKIPCVFVFWCRKHPKFKAIISYLHRYVFLLIESCLSYYRFIFEHFSQKAQIEKKLFEWNGFYILLVMYVRIRSKNSISQLSYRRKKKSM